MARFYSTKEMHTVLKDLGIKPIENALNTREAAQVLTWRAKDEMGIEYTYSDTTVRSRVHTGSLNPVGGRQRNSRYNTYKVEDVFSLPLYPRRGSGQRKQGATR